MRADAANQPHGERYGATDGKSYGRTPDSRDTSAAQKDGGGKGGGNGKGDDGD